MDQDHQKYVPAKVDLQNFFASKVTFRYCAPIHRMQKGTAPQISS